MDNNFNKGDLVEIQSGEHGGLTARVVAFQEVPGSNGNLYSVHENDIKPADNNNGRPIVARLNSSPNQETPTDPPTEKTLAEQLQYVADLAAQSETDTYSKYDMILNRLDEIDKRLEVKEIKVVVEVQHTYNKKEFATYSDEDRLIGYDTESAKATVNKWERISMLNRDRGNIDKRQLNFLEGEEE